MLRHVRNVNKPTSEDEAISNTDQKEKKKGGMAQTNRHGEPKERQNGEEDCRRQRSEFLSLNAEHFEKLHLVGHHAGVFTPIHTGEVFRLIRDSRRGYPRDWLQG